MDSTCVIYNRVSSLDQNPELQLKECREFAESKGWRVVKVFSEKASAWSLGDDRPVFKRMLEYCKSEGVGFIVVWNMDRFSRQPEMEVLELVKLLRELHNIRVVAVHGDAWSEVVEFVGTLRDKDFLGRALAEFLETLIRGMEFRRAFRESQVKSERVRLAVRERGGVTVSYRGRKWGRRNLPDRVVQEVLRKRGEGLSIREISKSTFYYDKNKNQRNVSRSKVHQIIKEHEEV